MQPEQEQLIAALEMRATVIGLQAKRVSRIALQMTNDLRRLELWSVAMDLEDESNAIREQIRLGSGSRRIREMHGPRLG
jgi:hypothetical protein